MIAYIVFVMITLLGAAVLVSCIAASRRASRILAEAAPSAEFAPRYVGSVPMPSAWAAERPSTPVLDTYQAGNGSFVAYSR